MTVYNYGITIRENLILMKGECIMKYETPVVEIVMFENEDIVTDSDIIEGPQMPA